MQRFVVFLALFAYGSCQLDPCDLPRPLLVQVSLIQPLCQNRGYCWRDGTCLAPRRSFTCDVNVGDRVSCPAINGHFCRLRGCCWDESSSSDKCYRRIIENPCNIPVSDRESCGTNNVFECLQKHCCFNPLAIFGSKCYREKDCDEKPYTYGPCSQTCGVGLRAKFDGCGVIMDTEECCEQPCPGGGSGGTGLLCMYYEPYKSSK